MSDAWLRAGSKQWLFLEQARGPSTTVSSRPASWLRARSLTRHRPDPRGARQVEGRRCSSREEDRSTVDSVSFRSRAADRKRPAAWTTARARVRPPSSPWASRSGRAHALALARAMVLRDCASTKKRVSKFVRKFQNWRSLPLAPQRTQVATLVPVFHSPFWRGGESVQVKRAGPIYASSSSKLVAQTGCLL